MKAKKLLRKLDDFLDAKRRRQRSQADAIRKVLHDLKKKERRLKLEFTDAADKSERRALRKRIDVVHAQRKKGLQTLRDL